VRKRAEHHRGQTTDTTANALRESTLSLSATPTITEAGGVLVYTATLTQAPLTDLTITLSNGSVIVIPPAHHRHRQRALAPNDTVYNDPTQIDVTVTGTTGGNGITVTRRPPGHDPGHRHHRHHHRHPDRWQQRHRRRQITYTATLTNPARRRSPSPCPTARPSPSKPARPRAPSTPTAPNDVYNNGSTVSTTITGATGGNSRTWCRTRRQP
jgi:surface adhesion protein